MSISRRELRLVSLDVLADTLDRRREPRVDATGLHFRCRPVDPRRWWRPDGVVGWIDDLSIGGARLRMHRNSDLRRRSRWVLRVGTWTGQAEVARISSLAMGVQGMTVGMRFVELDTDLRALIEDVVAGRRTESDWLRAMQATA